MVVHKLLRNTIFKWGYGWIKYYRRAEVKKVLDRRSKTMLDIGCQDLVFHQQLKKRYDITLADYEPKKSFIKKEDVQNLSFEDNSFDIVLCQEVLEHVPDPIAAMKELKRVAKKQLVISVPNEPFFTMFRLFLWEREHLWAITPKIFKHYLGKPSYQRKVFFKRYYMAVWNFED
jgi:ubiquinone/menaquinone biosynthesis C-methylase UbiE